MTWRDTLYLWRGPLVIEKLDDEASDQKLSTISWSGTRINCPDCPDSRQAPLPTNEAFDNSATTFDFMGTIQGPATDATIVSLTSGTWQHAGEGGDVSATPSPKRDSTHKLDLSRWLEDTNAFGYDSLVLGSGSNEYGDFIEMGWVRPGGVFRENLLDDDGKLEGNTLTLARRYLPEKDERSTWSFDRMFSEMKLGVPPILGEDVWSHVAEFLHTSNYFVKTTLYDITPWQEHVILHSSRYMIKRNNKGFLLKTGCGPTFLTDDVPPLKMPLPDGKPFQLRFVTNRVNGEPKANTTWRKQCWGCGGSGVQKDLEFDCRCTMLDGGETPEEVPPFAVPYPWIKGEFCCKECVLKSIPQIVQLSHDWKNHTLANTEPFQHDSLWLACFEDLAGGFWECVEQDQASLDMMTKVGWRRGHHWMPTDWTLDVV